MRGLRSQPGLDESGHAGSEGDVDVRLGQAPVPTVGTHDAEVVGEGEHRPGGERVSLQSRHRDDRQRQHPREQLVDGDDVVPVLFGVGEQPVQVEPVGVELAGGCGDQGAGAFGLLHLIERGADRGEPVGVEAVLSVSEVEDEHVVLTVERDHGDSFELY